MLFKIIANYTDTQVNVAIEAHSKDPDQDLLIIMFTSQRPASYSSSNDLKNVIWDWTLTIDISELSVIDNDGLPVRLCRLDKGRFQQQQQKIGLIHRGWLVGVSLGPKSNQKKIIWRKKIQNDQNCLIHPEN